MPCCPAPTGKGNQGATLGDGSTGAPGERHSGDAKTDSVVSGISEEIERIGLQSRRTGSGAGDDLGHEETSIDEQARATARAASAGYSALGRDGRGTGGVVTTGHPKHLRQVTTVRFSCFWKQNAASPALFHNP